MNIQIYAVIAALLIGGLLGHTYTKHYYEAEIAKLNVEAMAADVRALETQIKTEKEYQNVQDKAEKNALADYDDISRKYSLALSRGVLESSRSPDTAKVSNTTATASQTASPCNCGRLRQNYENFGACDEKFEGVVELMEEDGVV